jgi:DNA (cytosine-5)-methyltransferase 1
VARRKLGSKESLAQAEMFARRRPPMLRVFESLRPGEITVDNFAGGGGVSEGTGRALTRPVDIAINHYPKAIAMHRVNHPETKHFCENILQVNPREACAGRKVGLAWFAPDCTHHSKAKGKKPRDNKLRGLAWVVIDWMREVRPRIVMVENVEEFQEWGPLDDEGYPDPARAGEDFRAWLGSMSMLGYQVEYRCLVAADYGAPTSRKRFFLIARCDGRPIVWPEPSHGVGRTAAWRTAAEIIDWSIPCRSIFGRSKPLVEATLRRIGIGVQRYVIDSPDPFLIKYHGGSPFRGQGLDEPLKTVDSSNRFGLVQPFIIRHGHYSKKTGAGLEPGRGAGVFRGQPLSLPLATVCATNDKHLICPIVTKHYGGVVGHRVDRTLGTVTARDHHALTAAFLTKYYGTSVGSDMRAPLPTITGQGNHIAEVRAFLIKYYGGGGNPRSQMQGIGDPLHTVTSRARFGLVQIEGEDWQLADIGMRMLKPHELFAAQGFPDDYIIDPIFEGKPLTQEAQTELCGNAVPPDLAEALVAANTRDDYARAA